MARKGLLSRSNGLLTIIFSLVFALGVTSAAAAKPRHGHHAKAVSAQKGGGGHGPSDSGPPEGKGPDRGSDDSKGNGNGAADDTGHGSSNGQGNGNGQGNADDPKGNGNDPKGNGNDSKGNGNTSVDPVTATPGADAKGNGNGNGKGGSAGPKAVVDDQIATDLPGGLLGAPDIPLGNLPVELRPQSHSNVLAAPQAGEVLVSDGDGGFAPLDGPGRVPFGAFVDANQGVITIVNQLPDGTTQTGTFAGAKFQVRQAADGTSRIVLRGSSFRDICGKVTEAAEDGSPGSRVPTASAARAKSRKVVRSLWASDHGGKYQTYGRNSVATVRGTVWQTVDRCDGTLIRVAEGEVVVHDRRKHKDVVVTAGHSYLALDPGA